MFCRLRSLCTHHFSNQCLHPGGDTRGAQCLESMERALGALGAYAAAGRTDTVPVHEHTDKEVFLG